MNFGVLKEKIMRKALSIHDKMTLVLGLQLYHGRFNKHFFLNKYFQMWSLRFHFLTSNLILGHLGSSKKMWGKNHEESLIHP